MSDLLFNAVQTLERIPVFILNRRSPNPYQLHLKMVQVGRFPFIQQVAAVAPVVIPKEGDRIPGSPGGFMKVGRAPADRIETVSIHESSERIPTGEQTP